MGNSNSFLDDATIHNDLPYVPGGLRQQMLDLYLPKEGSCLPLIISIHRGSFEQGNKKRDVPVEYLPLGYAIASINYRLSHQATFPAQIEDCKAAVRWLRAHATEYRLDPDRFAVWGVGAGGYLATMLGVTGETSEFDVGENLGQSSRVQAVVDFYGPTDFLQMDEHRRICGACHDARYSAESRLIGGPLQANREKAQRANPVKYVNSKVPPFLIVHGNDDVLVPHHQSEILEMALRKVGAHVTLYIVDGGGHGKFDDPKVTELVQEFLSVQLRPNPPEPPVEEPFLVSLLQAIDEPLCPVQPYPIPERTTVHYDLPYVAQATGRQMLDLYLPNDGDHLPLLIYIHGGAFRGGDKKKGVPLKYLPLGCAIASLNYRFTNEVKFPGQVADCKAAVRWLRAHAAQYRLDPGRFVVWGVSAGGYLAAMLGTTGLVRKFDMGVGEHMDQSSAVQAVVDYSGPTDFLQMDEHRMMCSIPHNPHYSAVSQLIGGPIHEHRATVRDANPITYITNTTPPFFICHGDADRVVPHHQSEILELALKQAGVPVTFLSIVGAGHGRFDDPKVSLLTGEFLAAHLHLGATRSQCSESEIDPSAEEHLPNGGIPTEGVAGDEEPKTKEEEEGSKDLMEQGDEQELQQSSSSNALPGPGIQVTTVE